MASIDETIIRDHGLPKTWKCPHCGNRNRMGKYKEEEFIEFGKTMQHCDRCSFVHVWVLELSEEFKKKVIDMFNILRPGGKQNDRKSNRQNTAACRPGN